MNHQEFATGELSAAAAMDAAANRQAMVATVIAALILLVTWWLTGPSDPGELPLTEAERAGAIAGQMAAPIFTGLLAWIIAYFSTVRKASKAWKIGSLLILLAVGLAIAVLLR